MRVWHQRICVLICFEIGHGLRLNWVWILEDVTSDVSEAAP